MTKAETTVVTAQPGLVISHHGARLDVEDDQGRIWHCTTRRQVGALVCGDRVSWQAVAGNEGVIIRREERSSLLARPDSRGQLKPVAANIDQVVVVTAPHATENPDPEAGQNGIDISLIDPYVAAAELSHMYALIVINKIDLLNKMALADAESIAKVYRDTGYEVVCTSAKTGTGMATLTRHLIDKTSVVVGKSGAGKSSLIQRLLPDLEIRVADAGHERAGGKHTTSVTRLYHLTQGGRLIDSPGVREFGLWQVDVQELAQSYIEFRPFLGSCRFNDCMHLAEPGCAVQQAVQQGHITPLRMASYQRLAEHAIRESAASRS